MAARGLLAGAACPAHSPILPTSNPQPPLTPRPISAAAAMAARVKLGEEYTYNPLDELGAGSFAHVYRGTDTSVSIAR